MNTKSISCEYCDDTGYIEISGPGGCYDKECACVPFRQHIAELEGKTVNGVAPESWPPNRRTPEDSNAKAVALMRQHVASYKSIDAHRHNCLDLCRRLEAAEAKLVKVLEQLEDWCGRDLGTEPHISDIIKEARDE